MNEKNNPQSRKSETETVVVLGSTGSVGGTAMELLRGSTDRFRVAGLAAGRASDGFVSQIKEFSPEIVAVGTEQAAEELSKKCEALDRAPRILCGVQGLEELASMPGADKVLNALSGGVGIRPSLAAVTAGKTLLLANKEALVAAGEIITKAAARNSAQIIPVDSEHSAIFQCLRGQDARDVARIIITASGGPFRNRKDLDGVTVKEALAHPKWNMGPKISIDSATLMNKGLEVIEAMRLFDTPVDRIDVLVHPECMIHSMVSFCDGSMLAHMGETHMRAPVGYALHYPERAPGGGEAPDLAAMGKLTFGAPDMERFPCLGLAYAAAAGGGLLPAMISAADEAAVQAFLDERISFTAIAAVVEFVLEQGRAQGAAETAATLDAVLDADTQARVLAGERIGQLSA